ncbi:proline-rich transmembrane protein 1-like isoform X2 [Amphiura filiformis]|uniref:proline-rich transmembrane protein 1-like isoform X2 n=1 Tax=Amphiura filiformis TaxID=82378 RepID=UPI003B213CEF
MNEAQAPEMPKKGEDGIHHQSSLSGMDTFNQSVGVIPVEAPPPYSTVFVQGGNHPQCPNPLAIYPPGTHVVYRMPQPLEKPPDDHLIYAILVTVFCFWPTGIIAIIKSLDVQKSAQIGDAVAADTASRSALQMSRISLGIGTLIYILLCVVLVIEFVLIFSI